MIIRGKESVLVQGITGKQGTFWAEHMRDYGTNVIGGVNPRKAGTKHIEPPSMPRRTSQSTPPSCSSRRWA